MGRFKKKLNRINLPVIEMDYPYLREFNDDFFDLVKDDFNTWCDGDFNLQSLVLCDFAVEESLSFFIGGAFSSFVGVNKNKTTYVVNSLDIYTTFEEAVMHNKFPANYSDQVICHATIDRVSDSHFILINNEF
ncbi:hypothetical protein [Alteromonas sp. 14N.309.X.WAT.G.H12]|uniref:hypothetical protein n=1 Tax=Alteromonas sp. 14N.309.X.WAT.G.H12 TaxID=3120824 RepID=UPI002FD69AE5